MDTFGMKPFNLRGRPHPPKGAAGRSWATGFMPAIAPDGRPGLDMGCDLPSQVPADREY